MMNSDNGWQRPVFAFLSCLLFIFIEEALEMKSDFDYQKEIAQLVDIHDLTFTMNPGGGEFQHHALGRLQVYMNDDKDDYERLAAWLRTLAPSNSKSITNRVSANQTPPIVWKLM